MRLLIAIFFFNNTYNRNEARGNIWNLIAQSKSQKCIRNNAKKGVFDSKQNTIKGKSTNS